MSTISEVEPHRKFQQFHSHMTYMSYMHLSGGGHSGLWGCHRQLVIAFFLFTLEIWGHGYARTVIPETMLSETDIQDAYCL